jgi:hypothetical protein
MSRTGKLLRRAAFLFWRLPSRLVVYQQVQRWIRAGCFEIMLEDLPPLPREFAGHTARPMAMILDSPTVAPTPESCARAGYD